MSCNENKPKCLPEGINYYIQNFNCCCCNNDGLAIPPGFINYFAGDMPPVGWLKADGEEISREDYADLFAAIGTIYGAGDGSTTFNLPDLRGIFVKGDSEGRVINGETIDKGRVFGSYQGDAIRNITGSVYAGGDNYVGVFSLPSGTFTVGNSPGFQPTSAPGKGSARTDYYTKLAFDTSNTVPTAEENHPRNINLLPCIKY